MNLWKFYLSLLIGSLFVVSTISADDGASIFQQDLNDNDFDAVRDFVQTKRVTALEGKIQNLDIAGEVHVEWRHLHEKIRGINIRGDGGRFVFVEEEVVNDEIYFIGDSLPLSRNDFDVQFDLKIKYTREDAWIGAHIRYDNSAGVDDNRRDCALDPEGYHGSGSVDNLNLKQAFIGYNLYQCGDTLCFIELGRRGNLSKVFQSEIQFLSRLDGVFVRYQKAPKAVGVMYAQAAGFVVDERVNHFAWATEIGWLDIYETNWQVRYSFIDWRKNGTNRCFVKDPIGFKFLVSQLMVGYKIDQFVCNEPLYLTAGVLMNHDAPGFTFIDGVKKRIGKRNIGWWAGFTLGDIDDGQMNVEGKWAMNFVYAEIQAQAIPDNDVNLIGTGNALQQSFTGIGRGNVNFRGWQTNFIYGLTNNITLMALYERSDCLDKEINGSHEYSCFKLEAIYAF